MKNITDFRKTWWNRCGSGPGNQQRSQATAVDSCFALIKIHQHNLAGSCFKTDLISHNMYKWQAMKQSYFQVVHIKLLSNFQKFWIFCWWALYRENRWFITFFADNWKFCRPLWLSNCCVCSVFCQLASYVNYPFCLFFFLHLFKVICGKIIIITEPIRSLQVCFSCNTK